MAKRIEYIDIAKCLCINLMVFGHCGLQGYPHDWIYSFHMPFFFIVSGFFLKAEIKPFKEVLLKNYRQLLIPYFFFYILTIPFGLIYIYFHGEPITWDYLWKPIAGMFYGVDKLIGDYTYFTNGPLWFLLALFWARLLFMLNRVHNYSTFGVFIGACISYGLFLIFREYNVNLWSWAQSFMLYPYLCVGYLLNKKLDVLQKIETAQKVYLTPVTFLGLGVVSFSVPYIGSMEYGSLWMGKWPMLSFVIGLIGSLMILFIAKLMRGRICILMREIGGDSVSCCASSSYGCCEVYIVAFWF